VYRLPPLVMASPPVERPRLRLFRTAEATPATVCELAWRASAVVARATLLCTQDGSGE
jgi:hypothetical protein